MSICHYYFTYIIQCHVFHAIQNVRVFSTIMHHILLELRSCIKFIYNHIIYMYIYRIFATPATILFQGHRPVSDQHWRLASPLLCDVIWDWQLSAEHKSFLKLMEPQKKVCRSEHLNGDASRLIGFKLKAPSSRSVFWPVVAAWC